MAWGEKRCETRPKAWNWRGWVAIHAGTSFQGLNECDTANDSRVLHFYRRALARHGMLTEEAGKLPRGKILAVLRFTHCLRTAEIGGRGLSAQEKEFGNFDPGRFFFETSDRQELKQPIPWRGGQGLRIAPLALRKIIARELAR